MTQAENHHQHSQKLFQEIKAYKQLSFLDVNQEDLFIKAKELGLKKLGHMK